MSGENWLHGLYTKISILAVPLIFIVYLTYFQNAAVSFEWFWKSFSWQGSCYEKCVIEQV